MSKTEKKDLIYLAALKLFNTYWPKKVSVDMIVGEAGVGKGTFYNYYTNKEELYEQIFDEIMKGAEVYMHALVEKYPDPKERFKVDLINSLDFFCWEAGIIHGLMERNKDYYVWKINEEYLENQHKKIVKLLFSDVYEELFSWDNSLMIFTRNIFMFYKHGKKMRYMYTTDEEFKDFMAQLACFMVEGIFSENFQKLSSVKYDDFREKAESFRWQLQVFEKFN